MKLNAEQLNENAMIESDVVVVGSGPAGITLAHDFIGSGLSVNVLESGGETQNYAAQKLSEGELSGHLYEALESTHIRQVGGTANHLILKMTDKQYGYRYTPMEEMDFEQRDCLPNSGWPISKADLDPYYARVQEKCEIGHYDYSAAYWNRGQFELLPLPEEKAENSVFMFGPTRKFNHDFPLEISNADNVNIYTNATVVELICADDGETVEKALVRLFDGKEIYFKAKQFIIAANALQTPRLLLSSRRYHPNGIGNQYDNVGRYYMDHTLLPSGNFFPYDAKYINKMGFYDMQGIDGASILGRISLTQAFKKQQSLRNFVAILFPMSWNQNDLDAMYSLEELKRHFRWNWRHYPKDFGKHVMNVFKGRNRLIRAVYDRVRYGVPILLGLGNGGWSRANNNEKKFDRLELLAIIEQSPNRDNRVTLSNEKDALGCPKIKVHYEWDEADLTSHAQTQRLIGEALEETGLGHYEPPKDSLESVKKLLGLHHMMGTTRMSEDPKDGVVDKDCCVHGMRNLFIAGSATFTTGSFVNPTLTNLAISLRVADKVKSLLGK